jgi:hypothetical protein
VRGIRRPCVRAVRRGKGDSRYVNAWRAFGATAFPFDRRGVAWTARAILDVNALLPAFAGGDAGYRVSRLHDAHFGYTAALHQPLRRCVQGSTEYL